MAEVEVERDRRVAGEVFFKKGHMDLDCRSTASMVVTKESAESRWQMN